MSKPRLVHLIGGLRTGGAEGQLVRLGQALKARGWPQAVISLETGGIWRGALESAGIRVHEIARHPFKPWRHWQLARLLRSEEPDVLLSWSAHAAVYARWAGGRARRVFNVRGDLTVDRKTGTEGGRLFWYRGALESADFVVGNSGAGLAALRRAGVRLSRAAVIENIVAAPGRARPGEPARAPRIAAVGSLKPLKAYDVLLRALAALAAQGRRFELLLAGGGPERGALEGLAAGLGLGPRVSFLGELDDVSALLASAHLFAHPSRTEGLSNSILEAMGEGLPVVACRVGGNPEIVGEGETGLLVAPDRPDLLAAALGRLLEAPALRERMGAAGLRRVRERCAEESVLRRYEEVLGRL